MEGTLGLLERAFQGGERADDKDLELSLYLFFETFVQHIFTIFSPNPQILPDPALYAPKFIFFLCLKNNLRLLE